MKGTSVVVPQATEATAEQTRLQMLFDGEMQDPTKSSRPYKKTFVLLLSWKRGEFDTGPEVDSLAAVFEDEYNFTVEKKHLDVEKGGTQKQLNKYLADFVFQYDDEKSLLIIYYAGHGWSPEKNPNEFKLLRRTAPKDMGMKGNAVDWHNAEQNLIGTEGDVFAIFDCCNAGRLCQFRGVTRFEYLGACSADQVTAPPGHDSFTEALVWALKELRKESACSFPTSALQRKIKQAPGFPQRQYPPLGHRIEASSDHIRIAPHNPDDDSTQLQQVVPNEEKPPTSSEYFDLRFHHNEITDKVIEKTAQILNNALQADHEDKLPATRITFLKSYPPEPKVREPVQRLIALAERRRKQVERLARQWLALTREHNGRVSQDIAPPPSHASTEFSEEPLTPILNQENAQLEIGAVNKGLKRKADEVIEDDNTSTRLTRPRTI